MEEQVKSTQVAEVTEGQTPPVEEVKETKPVEETATTPPTETPLLEQPRKKTAQERIDEITRARRQAEREADYWKRVAQERAQEPQVQPQTPQIPTRPNINQYQTQEEYEDALFAWRDNKRYIETNSERMKRDLGEAQRSFNIRATKFREEHEDFDEVINNPVFSPAMSIALLKSENGPEVAYFLGLPENRPVVEKISNLPVEVQLYELGKLETNLLLAKKTRKIPSAPSPITPVGGSGTGAEEDPSKMSTEAWMEWEKKTRMDKLKKKYGG